MLADADLLELRRIAGSRWTGDPAAAAATTWDGWRVSLDRYDPNHVIGALIRLGETSIRFPALATLLEAARTEQDREAPPKIAPPKRRHKFADPKENLALFDRGAREFRVGEHAEVKQMASARAKAGILEAAGVDDERHMRIEVVGEFETKARDLLAAGGDPGKLARNLYEGVKHVSGGSRAVTRR